MTSSVMSDRARPPGWLARMNGVKHYRALVIYLLVVAAHWLEHAAQALQIYVFEVPRPKAGGLVGEVIPWLVTSELLHWGYAAFMIGGLVLLRPAFVGEAAKWWMIALYIQAWHFIEHTLLLVQAWTKSYIAGQPQPTSLLQLIIPRVETHLIYNMAVLIPLLTAVSLHWFRADGQKVRDAPCGCATHFPGQ